MFKHIVLFSAFIALVKGEGYYCPYESLGFDGRNDLLYDYYEGQGDYWIRMGRTGWETRESYCRAKGNLNLHSDAGEAKCIDSQGTCIWSGSSCEVNTNKQPDCFALCKAVSDGKGLQCLGNCPSGNTSRDELYNICNQPSITSRPRKTRYTPRPSSVPRKEVTFKQKKLNCVCSEEL
jgi:hypothetical protein